MRHLSLVASAIAGGTGALYIGVLVQQAVALGEGVTVEGGMSPVPVVIVTASLAALTGLTAYGSLGPNPGRRALALWAAVPGFFGLGYVALWSIGAPLMIGGILTLPTAIAALRGISLTLRAVVGWTIFILLVWGAVVAALLIPLLPLSS